MEGSGKEGWAREERTKEGQQDGKTDKNKKSKDLPLQETVDCFCMYHPSV